MISALTQSLHTGYIDKLVHSNKELLPQFLVNDKVAGVKVLTTIDTELKTCDEFWISVAFLTTSGLATLINTFSELQKKGIQGKILVSQYLNFTHPVALERLLKFDNIELRIATHGNFHSKGYLFRRAHHYNLIIGSSNLTAQALCSNKEWNLKISATVSSHIISEALNEFQVEFEQAKVVDINFIQGYNLVYEAQKINSQDATELSKEILPNSMQIAALENISKLRSEGAARALLISATGTGKTYLSAFDVKKFKPKKFLFVVHRENIAIAAMKSYKRIFGTSYSMGLYTGNSKDLDADFIFSTVQTMSKESHHSKFIPDFFDYIVIDETHRAGAESYQSILNYFKPKFLLGMTATPERTDGLDIFKLFDYKIAYEIRLNQALDEEMLTPFHYYGVTDIFVDGELLKDNSDFKLLTAPERVNRIIEKANFYGCDDNDVRGLIFCSSIAECKHLSDAFNERGYKTIALTGESSELQRAAAIDCLESEPKLLDYIFTVDIFNEGIDIPKVNQVIMLRPTQSAIVFIQQLGRGMRKTETKQYLTVIDFIGNYNNNYLVPVALFGNTTYNKDTLRNLMTSGSTLIPGCSTINFDKISRDKIFQAIDSANMQTKKDLVNDYKLLKFKLGCIPKMVDFLEHGSRDPQLYVSYSKSYFNFLKSIGEPFTDRLTKDQEKLLELFSCDINNAKRIEESILLDFLVENMSIDKIEFQNLIFQRYNYLPSTDDVESCINNLNLRFITEKYKNVETIVADIYNFHIVKVEQNRISLSDSFLKHLENPIFKTFLLDSTMYAIRTYNDLFDFDNFHGGFILYRKYSRKDALRILNWKKNVNGQTVGGSIISADKKKCALFVNYHKEDHISATTKYVDEFLNPYEFAWMSKSGRTENSNDIVTIKNSKALAIHLFIKKNNDEGKEFYYMGEIKPNLNSFKGAFMENEEGKKVSVVKITFEMQQPVRDHIYNYITDAYNN
jgi:superfamily II DNA or RNA helicase